MRDLPKDIRLVSNRGPFQRLPDGSWGDSAGGVATLLRRIASRTGAEWFFPWPGDPATFDTGELPETSLRVRPVAVEERSYRLHYDEFCNRGLWFAHSGMGLGLERNGWRRPWKGYRRINWSMARHLAMAAGDRPGVFLTQDFHLYLLPRLLRPFVPGGFYYQFIHVPWVPVADGERIPEDIFHQLLGGLLANDRIGLQTVDDVAAFCETVERRLGARCERSGGERLLFHRGRVTVVRAYPVGVDVNHLWSVLEGEGRRYGALLAGRGCKTIVRVDRLDPVKNIERGFAAYAKLLQDHPEWRGRVRFLAFLVPSREGVEEYDGYADRIRNQVEGINRRFGRENWRPVEAYYGNNQARALTGLRQADVILVNSLADGMNLVAKEGIAVNGRDAVLVLSHRAGAHSELGRFALGIDPLDVDGTAAALERGLSMEPAERTARFRLLRRRVETNDLDTWLEEQFADIGGQMRSAVLAKAR